MKSQSAAYSMSPRWRDKGPIEGTGTTPGPIYDPCDAARPASPSYSMQGLYQEREAEWTPGPGHYIDATSDITRVGNRPIAQASERWAKDVGRTSTSARLVSMVHTY